jgi:thiamine kinase-like enzyme
VRAVSSDLDRILLGLEQRLGPRGGPAVPLSGGITNRNYRVQFGNTDYVVRLPGKDTALLGISRTCERVANDAAAQLGIAPPVAAADEHAIVTEFVDGTPLEPAAVRAAPERIARVLRLFHSSSAKLGVRFWVPQLLDDYAGIIAERGGSTPDGYADARALADRIDVALPFSEPVPCHNDLLAGNIISAKDGDGVLLVDWEYAGMGHRLFDLGNLAVNNDFDDENEERLLAEYFGEPPGAARRAALKLMRLMSDAREGAWGGVQAVISELDFDFAGYAREHFDRLSAASEASSQLEEWLDAASA